MTKIALSIEFSLSSSAKRFSWRHTGFIGELTGESQATVEWDIPPSVTPGTYRIRHFGHHKEIFKSTIVPYNGTSSQFEVTIK